MWVWMGSRFPRKPCEMFDRVCEYVWTVVECVQLCSVHMVLVGGDPGILEKILNELQRLGKWWRVALPKTP
jgi:UDP-N-acetyl-D-mannosaminuronic acid transferase (WecB/TagA/CpsF family)